MTLAAIESPEIVPAGSTEALARCPTRQYWGRTSYPMGLHHGNPSLSPQIESYGANRNSTIGTNTVECRLQLPEWVSTETRDEQHD